MMNNFIKIPMINRKFGGGTFNVDASFDLCLTGVRMNFSETPVKIDTGCDLSTIPLGKTGYPYLKELKKRDILNNVDSTLSFGVESGGRPYKKPVTLQEKMDCSAIKFRHKIENLTICGMPLGSVSIFVNYDRTSNILIGMDILKTWDIHIGKIKSGETILLACPYNQINDEYLLELERTFRLGTIVSSAYVRNEI